MRDFFQLDSPLMTTLNRIFDCIVVSLLWFFCSLPILTIAAATNALYETLNRNILDDEGHLMQTFISAFRRKFLESIGQTAIIVAAVAPVLLLVLWGNMKNIDAVWYGPALIFLGIISFVAVQTGIYTFTLMRSTELSFARQLLTGFVLGIRHLPTSFTMVIILVAACIILDIFPYLAIIVPALVMWLYNKFLSRISLKYPGFFCQSRNNDTNINSGDAE